jgi:transcriptional regulator with XRE-family HTH domain
MSSDEDPLLARKRLRISLRFWREQLPLTQKQVAEALEWSMSKVVRIESGDVRVSVTDLGALLTLYGVSGEDEIARLSGLARAARRRPWYREYQNVLDPGFDEYLGYESSAAVIETFHTLLVPGLLQTADYARAVMAGNGAEDADARVALRLGRQVILRQPAGPSLHCLIDEAALHRQVGGPAVMREQLLRLRDEPGPGVSIGIIPFTAGAHASMSQSFTLLALDPEGEVLFQESAARTVTTREDTGLVAGYRGRFERLRAVAVRGGQVRRLIDAAILGLRDTSPARQPG